MKETAQHYLDLVEARRRSLRNLSEDHGGHTKLARALGYRGPSYVSQLLSGHRDFTGKMAASIEQTLKLPKNWMDLDHRGARYSLNPSSRTPPSLPPFSITTFLSTIDELIENSGCAITPDKHVAIMRAAGKYFDATGEIDTDFLKSLIELVPPTPEEQK